MTWSVYLVRTRNQALYCGITTDVERRFAEHCAGKGAKALRGRGPLQLEWCTIVSETRSGASKVEYAIKQLPKAHKERLVAGQVTLAQLGISSQ